MIGIGDYNFNGRTFARWDGAPFIAEDRRALQSMIVDRAFNMPRWQGEPGREGPLSIGRHSIAVGGLAALLAVREGKGRHTAEECLRYGVAHDFGEVLGLGDIAAPWLRLHPYLAQLVEQHQRAAEELFELAPAPEDVARLVKTADRLAVIFERRFFFADYSGRCESPEVVSLFEELSQERRFMPAMRPAEVERMGVGASTNLSAERIAQGRALPDVYVHGVRVFTGTRPSGDRY